MKNIYLPKLMTIQDVVDETPDTRTLKLHFNDEAIKESFNFKAGQFGEYSVLGVGECTFCIASSPTRKGYIECCFKKVGRVTSALADLNVGDVIGFRGPYGNSFPLDEVKGKNLLFVGGGIGLAPLRSFIWNCLDLREEFGDITIIYGARSISDLVYKKEILNWEERSDVKIIKTVDPGGEEEGWDGKVGFVPTVLKDEAPSSDNTYVVTCGPPIMIKFVLQTLEQLGFKDEQVYTTLENKMKCGVGKCGRCNIGDVYICKEGPVYNSAQVKKMYKDF
ncbi:MAG: FAD/NAD(P)-binding protein [Thermodesulfobacteriota bacterium]